MQGSSIVLIAIMLFLIAIIGVASRLDKRDKDQ
jgi:cbb3-type cytochrome oxidase subunit 3